MHVTPTLTISDICSGSILFECSLNIIHMAFDETAGVTMWKPPIVLLQDSTSLTEAVSILSLGSTMTGQTVSHNHKNNQKRN